MDFTSQIREHMPVVCSNGKEFGMVDHLDGDSIKLTKDDYGQHHWIPLEWVTKVDKHVHVDRPGDQVMREWSTVAPQPAMADQMAGDQPQGTAAY